MKATAHVPPLDGAIVDRLELYRDIQKGELQFRDQTIGSLSPFVGILTGLVGAILFYLRNSPPAPLGIWAVLFYGNVFLSGAALVAAICFVGAALWGFEYQFLASPAAIEAWRERELELRAQETDAEVVVERQLRHMLIAQVAEVASANRVLNAGNSQRAFRGKVATIVSLLLFALSLVPFSVLASRGG